MNQYKVNLDVRYELDVEAETMDKAVEKARAFQATMPTGWGKEDNVYWIDTLIVKESVERDININ